MRTAFTGESIAGSRSVGLVTDGFDSEAVRFFAVTFTDVHTTIVVLYFVDGDRRALVDVDNGNRVFTVSPSATKVVRTIL